MKHIYITPATHITTVHFQPLMSISDPEAVQVLSDSGLDGIEDMGGGSKDVVGGIEADVRGHKSIWDDQW